MKKRKLFSASRKARKSLRRNKLIVRKKKRRLYSSQTQQKLHPIKSHRPNSFNKKLHQYTSPLKQK